MPHIFHRSTGAEPPTAVRGEGMYLYDASGKRYLDGSGGAAVSCLGHGDADISRAIRDQVDRLDFAHTGFFTSEAAEALADKLIAHAPGDLGRACFVSGGSEAVEASLKLARQYFLEIGQPERHRIITRRQSYHGNTLGGLAAGGSPWRRQPFAPMLIETSHISPCYEYRGREDWESPFEYGQRVADELEEEAIRLGPETVMAFIAEPVVGATLGAVPAVEGYFRRIREICDRYGILLVLDEVMCGMGRTGTLFACEQDGVAPDIVAIAKGLGAGYQPIGAMLCSNAIFEAIQFGSGSLQHGHTYMGHPVACAAAAAVVTKLTDGGLALRSMVMGKVLRSALEGAFAQHPHVGEIRGRGLLLGLEVVADRETKAPFEPERAVHKRIKSAALSAGLACYPGGGTVDGISGDHVLLAPPYILDFDHIDEIVEKLGTAFEEAL